MCRHMLIIMEQWLPWQRHYHVTMLASGLRGIYVDPAQGGWGCVGWRTSGPAPPVCGLWLAVLTDLYTACRVGSLVQAVLVSSKHVVRVCGWSGETWLCPSHSISGM